MNKKEKYKLVFGLPYRVEFWKKSDKLGTIKSFMMVKDKNDSWAVYARRYDKSKGGGYNKPLRSFSSEDDAILFLKRKLNTGRIK